MEKLNKEELDWCVEWVTGAQHTPGPLPKAYHVDRARHELLWRFAILHRRDAGKLRVISNALHWRNVPIHKNEPMGEQPGKEVVFTEAEAKHGERLFDSKVGDLVTFDYQQEGTCPQLRKYKMVGKFPGGQIDQGFRKVEATFLATEGDMAAIVWLIRMYNPGGLEVNVVDA